jgi:Fe-S oxidoreductase
MKLQELKRDMEGCVRCSNCKWLPHLRIQSWRYAKVCPSIERYNFHCYSGGGKMNMANSLLDKRSELTDAVADVVYRCQLCGACQVSCQVNRDDIDLSDVLLAFRSTCVEQGFVLAEHLEMIESMKREDNTMYMKKADRGKWADGLGLIDINQEKAEVLFHAGCRYSYDEDLRDIVRGAATLLASSGVRLGIAGRDEACCGGRAFEIGYQSEMKNYAEDMVSRIKASGAHTLVTPCSDCYYTFKYLYPKNGLDLGAKVLHVSEYADQLLKEGKLRPVNPIPLKVTYHDPCHLGRRGEVYKGPWLGDNKLHRSSQLKQTGKMGIFDPPRAILESIPGIELVEMERIREYSWCCGAGGGVLEAEPEFAVWTAKERLDEAAATGATALVTACPWCERVFKDAVAESGSSLQVLDVMELLNKSLKGGNHVAD